MKCDKEIWKRWKEKLDIPKKLILDSLVDGKDGLVLSLSDYNDVNKKIEIGFTGYILSYRNRDEGCFLKKLSELDKKYGTVFYANWSLFEVLNSEYVKWFNEENCGTYESRNVRHFVFKTTENIVEVLDIHEPYIRRIQ